MDDGLAQLGQKSRVLVGIPRGMNLGAFWGFSSGFARVQLDCLTPLANEDVIFVPKRMELFQVFYYHH